MEKKVMLSILSQQTVLGEEPETIDLQTEGVLRSYGNGKFTLVYQESELTGLEGTRTTFKIDKNCVSLLREGEVNSELIFQKGQRYQSMYQTQYGALELGISTHRLSVRAGESTGKLDVNYTTELNHVLTGEHDLHVEYRVILPHAAASTGTRRKKNRTAKITLQAAPKPPEDRPTHRT